MTTHFDQFLLWILIASNAVSSLFLLYRIRQIKRLLKDK